MHIHVKTIRKSKETINTIFGKAVTPGVGVEVEEGRKYDQ